MLTRPEIEAQWATVKEAVQQRWAVLGGEELDEARSSAGRLVGVIQQRTGVRRDEIEEFLERVVRGNAWAAQRAVEQSIDQHPLAGILVTFAAGFVTGTLIGAACGRSR